MDVSLAVSAPASGYVLEPGRYRRVFIERQERCSLGGQRAECQKAEKGYRQETGHFVPQITGYALGNTWIRGFAPGYSRSRRNCAYELFYIPQYCRRKVMVGEYSRRLACRPLRQAYRAPVLYRRPLG